MGMKKKKRKTRVAKSQSALLRKVVFIGMAVLVLGLCFYIYMRSYIHRVDERLILKGVRVGNTDLSGLDKKHAKDQLNKAVENLSQIEITFVLDGDRKENVPLSELGFHIDKIDELLKEAVDFGKKGSTFARYRVYKKSENKDLKKEIPVTYKIVPEIVEKTFQQTFKDILHEPKDAKLTGGGGTPAIVEEVYGETIDIKKTVKTVNKFLNDHWNHKTGKIHVTINKAAPKVLSKDLEEVTDLLGTFTTYFGEDGSGRAENIKNGAQKITDITLMPGEEMSVDQRLEPFTTENGYFESTGYEGNKIVKSMGGGICQIATTLYNAVLLSELEVTSRFAHSLRVHYVEPAFDATVANDTIDFKFKNNLSKPVFIESITSNGYITCNIYGKETRNPNRTIEYVNEITGTTPRQKEYKASASAIGSISTERNGEDGLSANLYKVIYEDGVEISREKINHSSYQSLPEIILVGTASDNPKNTQKMNEAIASQKEETINKTIEEIMAPKPQSQEKPAEPAG